MLCHAYAHLGFIFCPYLGVDFRAFFPHDPNTDIPLPPTDDGFSPLIQIPLPFFPFSNNVLLSVSVCGIMLCLSAINVCE